MAAGSKFLLVAAISEKWRCSLSVQMFQRWQASFGSEIISASLCHWRQLGVGVGALLVARLIYISCLRL